MFGGLIPFKIFIKEYDFYTYNKVRNFFEKIKNVYGVGLGDLIDNKNIYNNILLNKIEFNYLRDLKSKYGKDANITNDYYQACIDDGYLKIFEMYKRGNIDCIGEKAFIPYLDESFIEEEKVFSTNREINSKILDDNDIFDFHSRYYYMYEKGLSFEDSLFKEIKNKNDKLNDIMKLIVEYYDGDFDKMIERVKNYYKEMFISKEKILKKKQFYLYEFVDKIYNEFDHKKLREMGKVVLPMWLIYKLIKSNIGLNIYIVDIEYSLIKIIDVLRKEVNGYVFKYKLDNKDFYLIIDDEQLVFSDENGHIVESKISKNTKKIKNIIYGDIEIEYIKRINEVMYQFILDADEKIIFDNNGNMYKYIKRIDNEFYF
jgi:hypothetical protein